jgi:tRNA(fMet)-specific endonuclease VapC
MSGRYLLDTNAIIALFAADTSIIQHMQRAEEVFVPSIAVGELDCSCLYVSSPGRAPRAL